MIRIFQSGWMAALMGAICYGVMTWVLWQKPVVHHVSKGHVMIPMEERHIGDPEMEQLVLSLLERKQDMDIRERKLKDWETRLQTEKQEFSVLTSNFEQNIAHVVIRVQSDEAVNLKRLAKMYAAMTPGGVAAVLKEMTDDQAARVLMFMKDAEIAPILETLAKDPAQAKRAAAITEKLRLLHPISTTTGAP